MRAPPSSESPLSHPHSSAREARPPKRVALFSGAYNHISDGVALTLNEVVGDFERRGIPVRVFAPTVDDPALDHCGTLIPVPSISFPGRSDYQCSLGLTRSVRRALRDFDPTLIQISTPDVLGFQALRYARAKGLPVAGTYHTHFTSYLKYYHLDWLAPVVWAYLRRFYQRCDHVYAPTTAMEDILRQQGIEQGLRLWRRGVDIERFAPAHRSLTWRRARGFADDEVVVAFVSRLVPEKGLDVFVRAIRQLEQQQVPHRSLVVGDGPARNELEAQLPHTVFTGFLRGEELATAYASSDLFLFPSDTETFGKVTIEAMASGLPTVCARAVGSRDLVQDGTTGRLCPPGDADAFANATRHLIEHPSLRRQMGAAAVEQAQDFAWPAILQQLVCHHDELLGTHEAEAVPAPNGAPASPPQQSPPQQSPAP